MALAVRHRDACALLPTRCVPFAKARSFAWPPHHQRLLPSPESVRAFHGSPRPSSSLFNLGGLSTSRENTYLSKERRIPRTEFSPHLELIRSSEIDTQNTQLSSLASTKISKKLPPGQKPGAPDLRKASYPDHIPNPKRDIDHFCAEIERMVTEMEERLVEISKRDVKSLWFKITWSTTCVMAGFWLAQYFPAVRLKEKEYAPAGDGTHTKYSDGDHTDPFELAGAGAQVPHPMYPSTVVSTEKAVAYSHNPALSTESTPVSDRGKPRTFSDLFWAAPR